ncbi:MAG: PIN domain-containing protein [Candidatus Kapabacteria bacterium]|nr:PIN domain-containing protein [Candidatus Kapabacteria bacterium]
MEIVDANIILRYLLGDSNELQQKASKIIDESLCILILEEVLAEVVYVLDRVYKLERQEIAQTLLLFIKKDNLLLHNQETISSALLFYSDQKIDFVDSILLAYSLDKSNIIHTLDKKLLRLINSVKSNS